MKRQIGTLVCIALMILCAFSLADVAIDAQNFPDDNFRKEVKVFDRDNNQILSSSEIEAVTVMSCTDGEIGSLEGIEHLTALKELSCYNNRLTALDVSKNKALEKLYCDHNLLTSLNVSQNSALEELECSYNQLTSLNVNQNSALQALGCKKNDLQTINVTGLSALVWLNCSDNPRLQRLDLSQNKALNTLRCAGCQLRSLDVSQNAELSVLVCENNPLLSQLDVSGCKKLVQTLQDIKPVDQGSYWAYEEESARIVLFSFDKSLRVSAGVLTIEPEQEQEEPLPVLTIEAKHLIIAQNETIKYTYGAKNTDSLMDPYVRWYEYMWKNGSSEMTDMALPWFRSDGRPLLGVSGEESFRVEDPEVDAVTIKTILIHMQTSIVSEKEIHLFIGKEPKAVSGLVEDGKAKMLVTEGTARNATVLYAVSSTKEVPYDDEFSTSVPRKTEAGTYYVWYKVISKTCPLVSDTAMIKVDIASREELPATFSDATGDYQILPDHTAVFSRPRKTAAKVSIPAIISVNGVNVKVTSIAANAFKKDSKLTTVTIGKNVKEIGKNAFAGCTRLKTVKGGAGTVTIQDGAFSGCAALKSFPTLSRLQKIGAGAFKGDKSLARFTLAKTVKSIGKNAFSGCKSLKAVTVKTEKLTESNVKAGAFKGISSKAVFQCPKKLRKTYAKLFVKKGAAKTCTFK